MLVDGWFDAEDFYGIFAFYDKMMTLPGSNLVSLVVGPWYHGQWVNPYMDGRTIGRIQFDSDTAVYFRYVTHTPHSTSPPQKLVCHLILTRGRS